MEGGGLPEPCEQHRLDPCGFVRSGHQAGGWAWGPRVTSHLGLHFHAPHAACKGGRVVRVCLGPVAGMCSLPAHSALSEAPSPSE